jgi:hypothetical protein
MRLLKSLDKIVQKERDLARKTSETGKAGKKAGKEMQGSFDNVGKSIMKIGAGFASFSVAKQILSGVVSQFKMIQQETIGFEDSLKDLAFVGDNAKNITQLRKQVLGLSNAWGASREEVAKAMFAIQSSTTGASNSIRDGILKEALKITRVSSTDLPSAVNMMTKVWNNYGKEVGSVTRLQSKLSATAQNVSFEELSGYLETVLAPAKAVGASFDDILAALSVAVEKGGKTRKTFTGVRDIFLKMGDAIERGYTTSKSFTEQLEDLSKLDTMTLKKLFSVETVGVIGSLTSSVEQYKKALDDVKGVQGDIAGGKYWEKLKDETALYAEINKVVENYKKNVMVDPEKVGKGWQDVSSKIKNVGIGFEKIIGPYLGGEGSFLRNRVEEIAGFWYSTDKMTEELGVVGGGMKFARDVTAWPVRMMLGEYESQGAQAIHGSLGGNPEMQNVYYANQILKNKQETAQYIGSKAEGELIAAAANINNAADTMEQDRNRNVNPNRHTE